MDISIKHLAAFLSVAEHGNFTRASVALAMSQPSLTAVIKQLEAAAGLQLFDRTTRRVLLTRAGESFLPKAQRVVSEFDKAITQLREVGARKNGCVRVASVPAFVVRVLPKVLKEFSREFPGIAVHIREENEAQVTLCVEKGEADFGFGSDFVSSPELVYKPLVHDPIGLLCRADHPLARGRRALTWKDLEGLPFVAFGPNTTVRRLIGTVEGLPKNVSEPAYEVGDVITMESLLEADLGVTAGFKLGAYRGRDRKLMFRPLVEPALGRTISLITHAERALSPAASALVDKTMMHLRRRTDGFRLDQSSMRPATSG